MYDSAVSGMDLLKVKRYTEYKKLFPAAHVRLCRGSRHSKGKLESRGDTGAIDHLMSK